MNTAKFKGDEFELDEIALLEGCPSPVRVIAFTEVGGGWWYVELPNGGYHYTQLLSKMPNSDKNPERSVATSDASNSKAGNQKQL